MPTEPSVFVIVDLDVVDGWPPISSESLAAHPSEDRGYVLDQTPAFALDLSFGDTVEASPIDADRVAFERRITTGGHRTFRLIALADSRVVDPVLDRLTSLGARVTLSGFPELWCIDVGPGATEPSVRAALEEATGRGVIEFEDPRTP